MSDDHKMTRAMLEAFCVGETYRFDASEIYGALANKCIIVVDKEFDAQLIAAAPDLYQALEDLQNAVREAHLLDVKKQFRLCVADNAAGKALAKARGENK